MNNNVSFWGEFKELIVSIKEDMTKYKQMWLAYTFLLVGFILAIVICVLLFNVSLMLMNAIAVASPDFFFDNPAPLFVWGFILYGTYAIMQNTHEIYLDIRKIIKKGQI